jgi:hypothetical protein
MRSLAFWDMSKSKARGDPQLLKQIAMHQSPVDVKSEAAVFDPVL